MRRDYGQREEDDGEPMPLIADRVIAFRDGLVGEGWLAVFRPAVGMRLPKDCIDDDLVGFVPTDRLEARIVRAALLWIGPLHRLFYAARIIGILDQPIGFDADASAARVFVGNAVVRLDLCRDPILDLHQIGSRDALIAIDRNLLFLARAYGRFLQFMRMILDAPGILGNGGTVVGM